MNARFGFGSLLALAIVACGGSEGGITDPTVLLDEVELLGTWSGQWSVESAGFYTPASGSPNETPPDVDVLVSFEVVEKEEISDAVQQYLLWGRVTGSIRLAPAAGSSSCGPLTCGTYPFVNSNGERNPIGRWFPKQQIVELNGGVGSVGIAMDLGVSFDGKTDRQEPDALDGEIDLWALGVSGGPQNAFVWLAGLGLRTLARQ